MAFIFIFRDDHHTTMHIWLLVNSYILFCQTFVKLKYDISWLTECSLSMYPPVLHCPTDLMLQWLDAGRPGHLKPIDNIKDINCCRIFCIYIIPCHQITLNVFRHLLWPIWENAAQTPALWQNRPVLNETEPLVLTFGITLQQIIDVVRKEK